jgi:serine/threonine protein kinase
MGVDPTTSDNASHAPPTRAPDPIDAPQPDIDVNRPTAEMSTITVQAPPFRASLGSPAVDLHDDRGAASAGKSYREEFGDFELLRVLGEGSFGRVYLARQVSLDRQVAVKISANRGSEARTLASLEHDHIVHVFSETIDLKRNQRVLCMQYVPGTTLERIIDALNKRERNSWSGQGILDAIDSLSQNPAVFHPAALRDRQLLAESDYFQAVCWFGARLAEALDYAHSQGVLHRDVKPANILVNQYGRPLLADFNISRQTAQVMRGDDVFGGTLGYMAPEHIDAFHPDGAAQRETVDKRCDIYSLGIVLFEMLTGRRPFDRSPAGQGQAESLKALAAFRRTQTPSPRDHRFDVPEVLDRVVARCLEPEADRRFQSAAEQAESLEGCRALRGAERELPAPGLLTASTIRHPFLFIALLALLPHVLGSLVNISYNAIQIVGRLSDAQQAAFGQMVLGYNLLVYPFCIWGLSRAALPLLRLRRDLRADPKMVDPNRFDAVRRRVLAWPLWIVALSCAGWLPGGIVFPLGISLLAGPVTSEVFIHFVISFWISGLIALTYSFFGIQFIALRVFYGRLWADARNFRSQARAELAPIRPRLGFFQVLSGAIPLFGAILLLSVGAEVSADRSFRILVTGLIGLGMAGFVLAMQLNNQIFRMLAAFAGIERSGKR